MLKKVAICSLILLCINSCIEQSRREAFLSKYEFEDFSEFNNVHIFIRDEDSGNPIVMMNAPNLVNDTSDIGLYVLQLDKNDYHVLDSKWTYGGEEIDADISKMQQLAKVFINYKIPRLYVDEAGNVFVYLKDVESLAMIRITDSLHFPKSFNHSWVRIRGNWYIPK